MILDYLYYGNAIQLSPNEMREYLETAFILENDYPIEQQIDAIGKRRVIRYSLLKNPGVSQTFTFSTL